MTYAEFKAFVITFLWKANDAQLIANLDNLIRMAEHELNTTLHVEERHTSTGLYVDNLQMPLPSDYHSMKHVTDIEDQIGEFKYVPPSDLRVMRQQSNLNRWLPFYSIEGRYLLFSGPTQNVDTTTGDAPPANPKPGDLWFRTTGAVGLYVWQVDADSSQWVQLTAEDSVRDDGSYSNINVNLDYVRKMPDFAATDTSWLADYYLNVYVYSVLKQCAPFLREDERIATWMNTLTEALMAANDDSAFNKTRGVPAPMPLPRQAGINRRRR